MRLTTLGTGTVSLTPDRVCAGYHLQAGAVSLLLDCGSGVAHRLAQHELAPPAGGGTARSDPEANGLAWVNVSMAEPPCSVPG